MARRVGLIAGVGSLPQRLVDAVAQRGDEVVAIRVLPQAMATTDLSCTHCHDIPIGQWNRVVQTLREHSVKKVYLAGKISREHLIAGSGFDDRFQSVLASLTAHNDQAVIEAFVADLAKEGIEVGEQTEALSHLLCAPGVLTGTMPTPQQWYDFRRGYSVAKALAEYDVGQTVVVKGGAVLAVEAVDGTDATIARGCELARGGAVVVKVAKPRQDLRFDVPTIGMGTLEVAARYQASVLGFDAGVTLLMDQDEALAFANRHGITMISYAPGLEERWSG